jgi:hypothetical protein
MDKSGGTFRTDGAAGPTPAEAGRHPGPHVPEPLSRRVDGDRFPSAIEPPTPTATIRPAMADDIPTVLSILEEAERWLRDGGDEMWSEGELAEERIRAEVEAGLFYLAEVGGEAAGTFRYQLRDDEFWPDLDDHANSAFLHRLAVRRRFAGGIVTSEVFGWAAAKTASIGRAWLRLDCDAHRARLRAMYERHGFARRDERQVGPYLVTRYEMAVVPRT